MGWTPFWKRTPRFPHHFPNARNNLWKRLVAMAVTPWSTVQKMGHIEFQKQDLNDLIEPIDKGRLDEILSPAAKVDDPWTRYESDD